MSRLVLFIHIQRTGGLSLSTVLQETLGKEYARIHTETIIKNDQNRFSGIKCILGHFCYGMHEFVSSRDVKYATFLRDPVQRWMSLYYSDGDFEAKTPENMNKHVRESKMAQRGTATRFIAGWSREDIAKGYDYYNYDIVVDQQVLNRALYNLEFNIDFVGFHAFWLDSVRAFQQRYGFPMEGYSEINMRKNRPRPLVPDDVKKKIYEVEWADTALYRRALELYARSN